MFKHSQYKPKSFGIKINIDLEANNLEKKLYLHGLFLPTLATVGQLMTPYQPQRKQNQWGHHELG